MSGSTTITTTSSTTTAEVLRARRGAIVTLCTFLEDDEEIGLEDAGASLKRIRDAALVLDEELAKIMRLEEWMVLRRTWQDSQNGTFPCVPEKGAEGHQEAQSLLSALVKLEGLVKRWKPDPDPLLGSGLGQEEKRYLNEETFKYFVNASVGVKGKQLTDWNKEWKFQNGVTPSKGSTAPMGLRNAVERVCEVQNGLMEFWDEVQADLNETHNRKLWDLIVRTDHHRVALEEPRFQLGGTVKSLIAKEKVERTIEDTRQSGWLKSLPPPKDKFQWARPK